MKKTIVLSVVLFFIMAAGYSQHLSVNAFGGYTFRDKINFSNAYTYINAGGMWGASIEGVNAQGTGLEILYQYQSTSTPTTIYIPSQTFSSSTVISYLLLNFEQYYTNNPKIQPYGGLGLGAAFYKSDYQGSTSETKFAWDIKARCKISNVQFSWFKNRSTAVVQLSGNGDCVLLRVCVYDVCDHTSIRTYRWFGI